MNNAEYRNATRRDIHASFDVVDTMTGQRIGQLLDLSASGLQLNSLLPLMQDALYQWRFPLPAGAGQAPEEIECGVHVLWVDSENPGEYSAGGRFIQISTDARDRIRDWCEGS